MSASTEAPIRAVLDRYEDVDGERLIVAVCHRGAQDQAVIDQVVDRSTRPGGRIYVIAAGMGAGLELDALLADYKEQGRILGYCPMSRKGIAAMLARGERQREAIC